MFQRSGMRMGEGEKAGRLILLTRRVDGGGGGSRKIDRIEGLMGGGEAKHKNIFKNLDLLRCIFLI